MQVEINRELIEAAFQDDARLRKRVFDAIDATPQHASLFEDIARYTEQLRHKTTPNGTAQASGEPVSKKRKIEHEPATNGRASNLVLTENQTNTVIFEAKDLSFQIPLRKKLNLEIARSKNPSFGIFTIRARNVVTDTIEYEGVSSSFEHLLRLPVPEKAQKQYNFCLIPTTGRGMDDKAPREGPIAEPLLWTVNDGAPLQIQIFDADMRNAIDKSDRIVEAALEYAMRENKTKVTYPDEAEFVSATPEAHRKGEKAYHVKAFKGSKEGYLFFLSSGVFFGFKKPLQFFPLDDIKSISYTSVLQRTFNLDIAYSTPHPTLEEEEEKEVEFSMIDQAQFAGIDAYVKKHELHDASMAEARKARRHAVNGKKGGDLDKVENGDEPGELQKAEQQIQQEEDDEEDELEEDYDPGSEGESEGSGTSSEDEDDYADGGEVDANLVEQELGSEAEEIEPDPEDEDQL